MAKTKHKDGGGFADVVIKFDINGNVVVLNHPDGKNPPRESIIAMLRTLANNLDKLNQPV